MVTTKFAHQGASARRWQVEAAAWFAAQRHPVPGLLVAHQVSCRELVLLPTAFKLRELHCLSAGLAGLQWNSPEAPIVV